LLLQHVLVSPYGGGGITKSHYTPLSLSQQPAGGRSFASSGIKDKAEAEAEDGSTSAGDTTRDTKQLLKEIAALNTHVAKAEEHKWALAEMQDEHAKVKQVKNFLSRQCWQVMRTCTKSEEKQAVECEVEQLR
jgi:hypothetical protein